MKKFLFDLTEVGKDLWSGFAWVVQAADELGCIAGVKLAEFINRKKVAKLTIATAEVKRNCIEK